MDIDAIIDTLDAEAQRHEALETITADVVIKWDHINIALRLRKASAIIERSKGFGYE